MCTECDQDDAKRIPYYKDVNVPLLRKTMETIDSLANDRRGPDGRFVALRKRVGDFWDQSSWRYTVKQPIDTETGTTYERCGTGMCFAGWAVHLTGGKWASDEPGTEWYGDSDFDEYLIAEPDLYPEEYGQDVIYAPDRARRVLGLLGPDGSLLDGNLFGGQNTKSTLHRLVDTLIDLADKAQPSETEDR